MFTLLTGDLSPTATYSARSWAWVSDGSGLVTHDIVLPDGEVVTEVMPGQGKLTIKVQHARRGYAYLPLPDRLDCEAFRRPRTERASRPRACEVDTYAVQEVEPEAPGCRSFLLLNLTDPSQREPYLTTVGGADTCRCKAGQCKLPGCKHRDAVEALIDEGGLPPESEPESVPEPVAAPWSAEAAVAAPGWEVPF